jgi:hypothetical protein
MEVVAATMLRHVICLAGILRVLEIADIRYTAIA